MPEFILDTDKASPAYEALSDLAKGFIECAFFQEQNTTGVQVNMATMETSWIPLDEVEEPAPIKAHWDHPEIQEGLREGTLDGTLPADCGVADLDPDTLTEVAAFCDTWYAAHKADADAAAAIYGMDRVGNDLCYGISGAGAGFFDRKELPEDLRARLDASAKSGELNAFWQDGKVYLEFYAG